MELRSRIHSFFVVIELLFFGVPVTIISVGIAVYHIISPFMVEGYIFSAFIATGYLALFCMWRIFIFFCTGTGRLGIINFFGIIMHVVVFLYIFANSPKLILGTGLMAIEVVICLHWIYLASKRFRLGFK